MTDALPPADTPLYNHPLPKIEAWLTDCGCQQNDDDLHRWYVRQPNWEADLWLDEDRLTVCYRKAGDEGQDLHRAFKYSLSREDIEAAIFAGP